MEITVLVEALTADGYRATSLAPRGFVVEALTREAALAQLGRLVREQFARGEVVPLHVSLPSELHPWHALAGTWKDHPDAAAFEQSLQQYRRQVDADPDRPMTRSIFDTDPMTLYRRGQPVVVGRVESVLPDQLANTIIPVTEQLSGSRGCAFTGRG